MADNKKEVASECLPLIRLYNDGTIERLYIVSPHVPPSSQLPGVSCKDVIISSDVSARLYLPKLSDNDEKPNKLPIFIYFHGGYFCFESAFSALFHPYALFLSSESKAIVVSVEYRLAPEHLLPAAYEDSWAALQWVASHSLENTDEPWLNNYGDFNRFYIGGDSCGANIAHNLAIRAGVEPLNGGVKILGGLLSHPYFWGSKTIGSESVEDHENQIPYKIWNFSYPSVPGAIDNWMINPCVDGAPSLSGLAFSRLLVCVSEKDVLWERGLKYVETVKESGWKGEMEVIEVEGEDHCFFLFNPDTDKAKNLVKRFASFIK